MAQRGGITLSFSRLQRQKKNPERCSAVLALGESSSKAIEQSQKTRLLPCKTAQHPLGVLKLFIARMPLQTVFAL